MLFFSFIFLFYLRFCICFLSKVTILAPSQIGEDPHLKFGDSTSSITDTAISAYKEPENPVPIVSEAAEEVLDELSDLKPVNRVEPKVSDLELLKPVDHESTLENCQRDYSKPCPLNFEHNLLNDGSHKCTPQKFYSGPCMGQDLTYKEMGKEEKIQWSKNCIANWPCVMCKRDYSLYCPENFECKSLNSYSGPCMGEAFSFIDYNVPMQKEWSRRCKSYWPCSNI
eukprot:XP_764193.1 hypothetical protein [Theileria parva strain Muguga]